MPVVSVVFGECSGLCGGLVSPRCGSRVGVWRIVRLMMADPGPVTPLGSYSPACEIQWQYGSPLVLMMMDEREREHPTFPVSLGPGTFSSSGYS